MDLTGAVGERSEHRLPQAPTLPPVCHDERDFCVGSVVQTVEAGDSHDVVVGDRDDRLTIVVVDVRESMELVGAELWMHCEEPEGGRSGRQGVVEADEAIGVVRLHLTQVDGPPVHQRDALNRSVARVVEGVDSGHAWNATAIRVSCLRPVDLCARDLGPA